MHSNKSAIPDCHITAGTALFILFSVIRKHHRVLNGIAQAQFTGSSGSRLVKGSSVIYRYAYNRKSQRNIHTRNGIPRMFLLIVYKTHYL